MIVRITNLAAYTALTVMAIAGNVHATTLAASGTFTRDDDVATFTFDVVPGNPTQTVTLRTLSYAGGTNDAGQVIPSGGFDPIVTVLDSIGLIQYREASDLGLCNGVRNAVSRDPVTNQCFDKVLVMNLTAGRYTVEITQFDNARIGPSYGFGFSRASAPHGGIKNPAVTRGSRASSDFLRSQNGGGRGI